MKKLLFSFLAIPVVLCIACTTYTRQASSLEDSVSINISCRDENGLKQDILQQFRFVKAKDVAIDANTDVLIIKAAFRLRDTPLYKIENLRQHLQETPGVVFVSTDANRSIVKQVY